MSDHGNLFRARFPGSGQAWLRALTDPLADLPARPALLWVSVDGKSLHAARLPPPDARHA